MRMLPRRRTTGPRNRDGRSRFPRVQRRLIWSCLGSPLLYKWHGQPLSVFVVPHSVRALHDQQELVEKFGHEAVVWSGADRTYVLLARARPSELPPVVGYVRAHAH